MTMKLACVCDKTLEKLGLIGNCTSNTGSFSKLSNSWIGYENTSEHKGLVFSHSCPYDYCQPFSTIQINLTDSNGADQQCANNRIGKLCSSCRENYSISAGPSNCIECGDIWPLNTVLITLTGVLSAFIGVALFLFFDLTVTAGTINGFFFTANILKAIFPFPQVHGYPTYLYSLLNFDFGFDVCYYKGFDTYIKVWIQLELPVCLFIIVFAMILISRWSPRFVKLIGKRNPVEMLATVIFALYAKLLQFVIDVFSYGELQYLESSGTIRRVTVWLPDANIVYLEPKHAVMFIVAILVLIVVFLYTLMLFSWQWLLKLPNWKVYICRTSKQQAQQFYRNVSHSVQQYASLLDRVIASYQGDNIHCYHINCPY